MIRMINAIRKNDGSAVLKLLNQGMDPNKIYREGDTSRGFLSFAIEAGDEKIVRLLLEKGASPDQERVLPGKKTVCPLYESLFMHPNDRISRLLIEKNADANHIIRSDTLEAPVLTYAMIGKNAEMVRLLLEKGADPNGERVLKASDSRVSMLCDSVGEWPDPVITKLLIDHGANVNYIGHNAKTRAPVLTLAICCEQVEQVRLLLENGADPRSVRVLTDRNLQYTMLEDCTRVWPNAQIEKLVREAADIVKEIRRGKPPPEPAQLRPPLLPPLPAPPGPGSPRKPWTVSWRSWTAISAWSPSKRKSGPWPA